MTVFKILAITEYSKIEKHSKILLKNFFNRIDFWFYVTEALVKLKYGQD
jgi:hypothetical protein